MAAVAMNSSTPNTKGSSKTAKQSKKIILRIRPDLLAAFPSHSSPVKAESSNPSSSSQPGTTPTIVPPPTDSESADKTSDQNDSPMPPATPSAADNNSLAPPADGSKKKGALGPKIGSKRSAPPMSAGAKGRPGPKKKPRLADGTIDRTQDSKKGPFSVPAPITASGHKLGPKANTGAINAGLRALDRSGKPCRRWERKGFALKSFTGVSWALGSWSAPVRDTSTFSGDVKSDSSSAGDIKPVMNSSAVPSERSASDTAAAQQNGPDSSPVPQTA